MKYRVLVIIVILLTFSFATIVSPQEITHYGDRPAITQGGDNINDAFPIPDIPFSDSGTTAGYTNDYAGNCGQDNGAPDVVYSYTAPYNMIIIASLCGQSNFDTRLYVFEDNPENIIACNDDYCGLVSQINCLELSPGHTYYFVIDGYGTAAGDYSFYITLPPPNIMLSGNVTEFGDGPLSGVIVRVLQNGSEVWHDTTDSYGYYYVIYLNPGEYSVEASKPGYMTQTSDPVELSVCLSAYVDFEMQRVPPPPPIGAIAGTVKDSLMNEPLEGVFVSAHQDGTEMTWYDTTDASGEFLFPECQTQSHTVGASMLGYITQTRFNVEVFADETTYVNFSLVPEGPPHCSYIPGDINGNGTLNGIDIVYGVNYFKGGAAPPVDCNPPCLTYGYPPIPLADPFFAAGDINGNCVFNGVDLTYFVRYLKLQVPSPLYCPDCPPAQ
jgi:hypothetical protein